MVMKNGKIVGLKKKKVEAVLDNPSSKKRAKPLSERASEEKAEKKAKSKKPEPKVDKKTRKESKQDGSFLQLGEHGFLTVSLSEDDNGKPVVAFRKFYTTKTDSEKKPARGGFNMQASSAELKILAAQLRQIAKEIDGD